MERHSHYPFIFAANRDERHNRPTRQAQFWEDAPDVLAGRDEVAGGTWCGVTREGRFAAVSNFRDPAAYNPEARSRGELVADFLTGSSSPQQYLTELQENASAYNGFNLLFGDLTDVNLVYFSNRGAQPEQLPQGIHGISNHLLNTPWPKVERSKKRLARIIDNARSDGVRTEALFELLRSTDRPADDQLPRTGLDLEAERLVSAPFIIDPAYGTRSSTVILLDESGTLTFSERSYDPEGNPANTSAHEFSIE